MDSVIVIIVVNIYLFVLRNHVSFCPFCHMYFVCDVYINKYINK